MQKIRGLYKITNECTGLFYIGKSTDIYKRWVNHKRDFEKGTHAGGAFQYDYDLLLYIIKNVIFIRGYALSVMIYGC